MEEEKVHIVSTDAASAYAQGDELNLRATESGTYNTELSDGRTYQSTVTVPDPYDITNWDLTVESWTAGTEILEQTETIGDVTTVNRKTATQKTDINVQLDRMTTWTNIPEVGRSVSGLGHYEASFEWDADSADGAYLDFGDTLVESMEVWINGVKVGGTESGKKPGYTGGISFTKPIADISDYLVDVYKRQLQDGVVSSSQADKSILRRVLSYAEAAYASDEFDTVIADVQESFAAALHAAREIDADLNAGQEEVDLSLIHIYWSRAGSPDRKRLRFCCIMQPVIPILIFFITTTFLS